MKLLRHNKFIWPTLFLLVFLMVVFSIPLVDNFLKVIKRAHETPVEKFAFPQTSSQEIGWHTKPLVSQ